MSKRRTLTLDDDVAAKLDAEVRRSGRSFDETANTYLRRALSGKLRSKPFKVQARDVGLRPGLNLDSVEELLDKVDGPDRR